jgi:Flp pilus assembly CpaF family ATPase
MTTLLRTMVSETSLNARIVTLESDEELVLSEQEQVSPGRSASLGATRDPKELEEMVRAVEGGQKVSRFG